MNKCHLQEIAAEAKEILCEAVEYKKALSLRWVIKPLHGRFSLPRGLVRYFRSIVRIDVVEVLYRRHHRFEVYRLFRDGP